MQDFEKLGQFYLGRLRDPQQAGSEGDLLLYDSKDLVTHAVCVGMTGSGKTGLCLALIEEAAIDGVPALVIDPKGDISNLLLTFPNLAPEDFAPWVNEEDGQRAGLTVTDYAAQQANLWKKGLADWGQDGARIARLKNAADFTIYTPGSTAGVPISIVASFAAPPAPVADDTEWLRDRIQTTATSLLGLMGFDADPLKSREHILLSTIFQSAWAQRRDLTLPDIIQQIQSPPVARVGVMDLDAFFPPQDRFALAMALNNLLAAPGFDVWMQGEPLDIGRLLYTSEGKPRVSICSIAHLGDTERMFFVSLLLNQVVGWMRSQSGTTSLRAIVYMDEIFGYFPPVANPPSKAPLLTLLKQARAYGVGVVLATQNPVDLDYKGLANAGTWFLGRLQTERDKARVLDGLEGSATSTGRAFDRRSMEQTLSGLASRTFVMNNVHEDAPVVFQSRWALSYLRGPLGRHEIKRLMANRQSPESLDRAVTKTAHTSTAAPVTNTDRTADASTQLPILPAGLSHYFIPARGTNATLTYRPMIYGAAQVRYVDAKSKIDTLTDISQLTPLIEGPVAVDWNAAVSLDLAPGDLETAAASGARFVDVPANVVKARSPDAWSKEFLAWLYGSQSLDLLRSQSGVVSNPGESERDFRIRLQQTSREARDAMVEKLRQKYAPKVAAAQERVRRAEQTVSRESEQAKSQSLQTAISFGTTLLGALVGRKAVSMSTLGRATTAARGVGRSIKESQDIGRAKETVGAAQQQLEELNAQLRAETDAIEARFDSASEPLQTEQLKPKKTNITVRLVTLVWAPFTSDTGASATPAW
ncbi:MAG: ATP-binding protein [Acidobacteria bacterium]|nr:ATP-binding protein [Acidobacteriota bacterium]